MQRMPPQGGVGGTLDAKTKKLLNKTKNTRTKKQQCGETLGVGKFWPRVCQTSHFSFYVFLFCSRLFKVLGSIIPTVPPNKGLLCIRSRVTVFQMISFKKALQRLGNPWKEDLKKE